MPPYPRAAQFQPSTPFTGSGVLGAKGASVTLLAPGAVSAVVRIVGSIAATLRARGLANDGVTPTGTRRIFKAGTGSLGVSQVTFDGSVAMDIEYRFVLGDNGLVLDLPAWSSGQISVEITATTDPSLLLVHAAVHSTYDEALRGGRVFKAGTVVMSIKSGNFGNFVLNNPAGNPYQAITNFRKIFNTYTTLTTFQQFINPGPITTPGAVTVVPQNSRNDSSLLSGLSLTYLVQNVDLSGNSSTSVAGPISPLFATSKDEFTEEEMLAPGTSIGISIAGQGGGAIGSTLTAGGIQRFYAEPLY